LLLCCIGTLKASKQAYAATLNQEAPEDQFNVTLNKSTEKRGKTQNFKSRKQDRKQAQRATGRKLKAKENTLSKELPLGRTIHFPQHETVGEAMENWHLYEQARCKLPEHIGTGEKRLSSEYRIIYQPVEAFHRLYMAMNHTEFDLEFDSTPLSPYIQARAIDLIDGVEAKFAELGLPQISHRVERNLHKAPVPNEKRAGRNEAEETYQAVRFPQWGTVREAMADWESFEITRKQFPEKIPNRAGHASREVKLFYKPMRAFRMIYGAMNADEFDAEFGGLSLKPRKPFRTRELLTLADEKAEKLGLQRVIPRPAGVPRFPRCRTLGDAMKQWGQFEETYGELRLMSHLSAARKEVFMYYNSLKDFRPILEKLGEDEFNRRLGNINLRPYSRNVEFFKELAKRTRKKLRNTR
jgi:hypothetical protein